MSDHTQSSRPEVVRPEVRVREAAMNKLVADAESMGPSLSLDVTSGRN